MYDDVVFCLRRVKLEIRVDLEKTYSCGSVIPWEFSCFNGNVLVGRKINSSFLSDQSGRVRFVLVTPNPSGATVAQTLKRSICAQPVCIDH